MLWVCYHQIDEVTIIDTQNAGFNGQQVYLMENYNQNQLFKRAFCANGNVSVMIFFLFLRKT